MHCLSFKPKDMHKPVIHLPVSDSGSWNYWRWLWWEQAKEARVDVPHSGTETEPGREGMLEWQWRACSPPGCPAWWSWCPGIQMSGRLCAMLPSRGIFILSITGMSAVSAQRYGAKLHLQECSLHFLDCNVALLTSPILSPGAQKEQPPNIATDFWRHFWLSHCTNLWGCTISLRTRVTLY